MVNVLIVNVLIVPEEAVKWAKVLTKKEHIICFTR